MLVLITYSIVHSNNLRLILLNFRNTCAKASNKYLIKAEAKVGALARQWRIQAILNSRA